MSSPKRNGQGFGYCSPCQTAVPILNGNPELHRNQKSTGKKTNQRLIHVSYVSSPSWSNESYTSFLVFESHLPCFFHAQKLFLKKKRLERWIHSEQGAVFSQRTQRLKTSLEVTKKPTAFFKGSPYYVINHPKVKGAALQNCHRQ